jgi:hypothetical protein
MMKRFSSKIMSVLRNINNVIDMKDYAQQLDIFVENNWKQELKIHGRRTKNQVIKHSAMGLAAEIALTNTGYFSSVADIVEDANKNINYTKRKRDLLCEGFYCEVKSSSPKYKTFYVSQSVFTSLIKSKPFNDFVIVMDREDLNDLVYRITPKYLIDIKQIIDYIVPTNGHALSRYIFDHQTAENNNACITLHSL